MNGTALVARLNERKQLFLSAGIAGFLGTCLLALFGTTIGALPRPGTKTWYFTLHGGAGLGAHIGFYSGGALLLIGWVGIGFIAYQGGFDARRWWIVAAAWGTPLLLGPPLFSRDVYSYIGQGLIARRGMNPYSVAPVSLGNGPILESISTVWHHTPSPYGPLIMMLGGIISKIGGNGLISQIFAFRMLELVGVVMIMLSLPVVARRQGVDPGIAIWLGALSPLALFSFLASAHNDALMVGLMMLGIAAVVTGRFRWGIALCALAASVKLPALAAVVFLTVNEIETSPKRRRWKIGVEATVITAGILAASTYLNGFGWGWIGPKALHIPTEVRVLITPTVSLGMFFHGMLQAVGISVAHSLMISIVQDLGTAIALGVCLWLLFRIRRLGVLVALGLALMVFVVGSPTVWPWYWTWGIVILGATTYQRSKILAAIAALAMFVVGAGGTPLFNGGDYWYLVPIGLVGLGLVFFYKRRPNADVKVAHGI